MKPRFQRSTAGRTGVCRKIGRSSPGAEACVQLTVTRASTCPSCSAAKTASARCTSGPATFSNSSVRAPMPGPRGCSASVRYRASAPPRSELRVQHRHVPPLDARQSHDSRQQPGGTRVAASLLEQSHGLLRVQ